MKDKIKNILKKVAQFLLNPRLLLCIAIAWMITNGWSYIMFALGTFFDIPWMIAVGGAYLAFLWIPFSPEKIVTAAIAIALLRFLFPKDERTLAVLKRMYESAKRAIRFRRNKEKCENKEKTEKNEDIE